MKPSEALLKVFGGALLLADCACTATARGVTDESAAPRYLLRRVPPITSEMILPDSPSFAASGSDTLSIVAAPGEYEPASFVLWSPDAIEGLRVIATDLLGVEGKRVSRDRMDIRIVKRWYQAGEAWHGEKQRGDRRTLIPELLLHDDTLVEVDDEEQKNYLRIRQVLFQVVLPL